MPRVDRAQPAQRFHISDEVCGGVAAQFAVGRRSAGAALIEKDHAIARRIKEAPAGGGAAAAGSAMQEDHRNALRVAALLPVQRVNVIDSYTPRRVWFDLWI